MGESFPLTALKNLLILKRSGSDDSSKTGNNEIRAAHLVQLSFQFSLINMLNL